MTASSPNKLPIAPATWRCSSHETRTVRPTGEVGSGKSTSLRREMELEVGGGRDVLSQVELRVASAARRRARSAVQQASLHVAAGSRISRIRLATIFSSPGWSMNTEIRNPSSPVS